MVKIMKKNVWGNTRTHMALVWFTDEIYNFIFCWNSRDKQYRTLLETNYFIFFIIMSWCHKTLSKNNLYYSTCKVLYIYLRLSKKEKSASTYVPYVEHHFTKKSVFQLIVTFLNSNFTNNQLIGGFFQETCHIIRRYYYCTCLFANKYMLDKSNVRLVVFKFLVCYKFKYRSV